MFAGGEGGVDFGDDFGFEGVERRWVMVFGLALDSPADGALDRDFTVGGDFDMDGAGEVVLGVSPAGAVSAVCPGGAAVGEESEVDGLVPAFDVLGLVARFEVVVDNAGGGDGGVSPTRDDVASDFGGLADGFLDFLADEMAFADGEAMEFGVVEVGGLFC